MFLRGLGIVILAIGIFACAPDYRETKTLILKDDEALLFRQGVEEVRAGDYLRARATFNKLVTLHRDGKFVPPAEVYLKLMNEIDALKILWERKQKEGEKIQGELQEARQELKRAQERCQKEIEDLKRDLEYLKSLDIELQRRSKSVK